MQTIASHLGKRAKNEIHKNIQNLHVSCGNLINQFNLFDTVYTFIVVRLFQVNAVVFCDFAKS